MRLLFLLLFISLSATAQNFDDFVKKVHTKAYNQTLTIKEIDSAINSCPDISKYPELLFYKSKVYDQFDNFPLSIKYLLEAKKTAKDFDLKYNILNNLGLSYEWILKFDKAKETYNEALVLAKKKNDFELIKEVKEKLLYLDIVDKKPNAIKNYEAYLLNASNYKNNDCSRLYMLTIITEYYNINEQYKKSENLFNKNIINTNKVDVNDCSCSIQSYFELKAEVSIYDKSYKKAIKQLDSIPFNKFLNPCLKTNTYKAYKEAYKLLGDKEKALQYNDTLVAVLDKNLEELKDSNSENVTNNEIERTQVSNNISILNMSLLIFGVIILLALILLIYSKKARLKLQSSLNFHKDKYNNLWANYQLSTKQLEKLKEELVVQTKSGNQNRELNTLLKDLSIHLSVNKDDEHKHVNMLKDKFINTLHKKAPYLNDQEQLICFFINLNLPHKKIAELLNKTEKSIDSYKYRINAKVKKQNNITVDELFGSL